MFCANYLCWLPSCQKHSLFASLIALFAWFLAHLNWSHIAGLLEEIAFFLKKSRFRILVSNSLVIHGDRFFRILLDLSGACLSTQPRNISIISTRQCWLFSIKKGQILISHYFQIKKKSIIISIVLVKFLTKHAEWNEQDSRYTSTTH